MKEVSANLPPAQQQYLAETYIEPAVLCISSRQVEDSATEALNLIRSFLPAKLNHKVVLTSDELRDEMGPTVYHIIHTALYICP